MKVRFIFNPHSGRNRRDPILRERAAAFIAHCGWTGSVVNTERPRHATELARRAVDDGCALVVAIGGDGTMNEVATALVNTPAVFGLIPCGSGNGFGRHLGIPVAGHGAFRLLAEGRCVDLDTGSLNANPFFCAAGAGFEALIATRFAALTSRGFAGYLRESARAWWDYRPEEYTIHHEHGRDTIEAFTLVVANASQYGNNAYIAPGASMQDALLDLVAVPRVNALNAGPLVLRLFLGSLNRVKTVRRFQSSRFVIERERPGWVHTDGEPRAEARRLEVCVAPASLRVMVPRVAPAAATLPAVASPAAIPAR